MVIREAAKNQSGASSPAHFQPRRPNYARRQERSPEEDIDLDGLSEEERVIENDRGPASDFESGTNDADGPRHPDLVSQLTSMRYKPLPDYLERLAPGMKQRNNPGGGICLSFSISQHANVDVQELKRYANRHLSDHFGQYRGNIQFPLTVDKGTGENRDTRFFETEEEFLLFINTDNSLNSWNTGESEILVLATIINQPITVVHFQQQGFAPGTPLEQRCDVKVYQPIPFLETDSPYKQTSGPWLLHEGLVHFLLLVPNDIVEPQIENDLDVDAFMNEIADDELDVDAFINGIRSSIFPGETDPNGNLGDGTIPTTQTSTSCPAQNLLNVSRSDVSKNLHHHILLHLKPPRPALSLCQ